MESKLRISVFLWLRLMKDLKMRGNGERESGAFLLGQSQSAKVTSYICYDDLDPNCLNEGYINFDSSGFIKLWDYCLSKELIILADVHTHPSDWTNQSEADRTNPMVSQLGHIAFIVPNYAQKFPQLLKGVGMFTYLGGYRWKKEKNPNLIKLTL